MSEPLVIEFPPENDITTEKCLEILDIPTRMVSVRKNPSMKFKSVKKQYTSLVVCFAVLFAVALLMKILGTAEGAATFLLSLCSIGIVFLILAAFLRKNQVKKMKQNQIARTLTIDENGVELKGEDASYGIPWKNIFCIREFKYFLAFVPKESTALIIICDKEKGPEIYSYMVKNGINIEYYSEN